MSRVVDAIAPPRFGGGFRRVNSSPVIAFAVFFVFGMHEAARGTTSVTIRQRVVPTEFQGRVASVNVVGVFSTLVLGALLGERLRRVGASPARSGSGSSARC